MQYTRGELITLCLVYFGQIVVASIILLLEGCSARTFVEFWVLVQTILLLARLIVYRCMLTHRRSYSQLNSLLDWIEISWFMLMCFYLSDASCDDTLVTQLAVALFCLAGIKIFYPCILVLVLFSLACLCGPLATFWYSFDDPKIKFQHVRHNKTSETCCICLDEHNKNQFIRILPCLHHFHSQCVTLWLESTSTCPLCRTRIV